MCKFKLKSGDTRIDPCMRNVVKILGNFNMIIKACCCGHKKHPMSIVVSSLGGHYELFSGVYIPRRKRFYKRDKKGYYFIPEVKSVIKSKMKEER